MSGARGYRKGGMSWPRRRVVQTGVALVGVVAIAIGVIVYATSSDRVGPLPVQLPSATGAYLGVYANDVPASYANVSAFASATGTKPDVVMYYSGWFVPFPTSFAVTAAANGAAPLVQIDPDKKGVTVTKIIAGKYDGYLSEYAEAVRQYGHPVILSFGHEMNGSWESWGYGHVAPKIFVAAWRHIVDLFRALGARNVTWLWTVNIINNAGKGTTIPSPAPWWPGNSYVNWVGIDGYYLEPSWQFAPLFGPTIREVRALTDDPILIAETGAVPAANQPSKITNLFGGIRSYGLLGFVWFNQTDSSGKPFAIDTPAAIAAFRQGASSYHRPGG